jgi:hypothetical protein
MFTMFAVLLPGALGAKAGSMVTAGGALGVVDLE